MACTECTLGFLGNPVNLSIVIISLIISVTSLVIAIKKSISLKKKLFYIYSHIFFLVLPVIYYLFFRGCQSFFSGCDKAKTIAIMLVVALGIAIILGMILAPLIFVRKYSKKSILVRNGFIDKINSYASKLIGIKKPKIYLLNAADPIAFSLSTFKPKIFLSIGMLELLNKKEIESVILHEMAHIKNNSSLLKFSTFFIKISPLAMFTSFNHDLNKEEINADNLAIKLQGTNKFILSTKKKINGYKKTKRKLYLNFLSLIKF